MRVLLLAAALLVSAAATARADITQPGSYDGPLSLAAGPVVMGDQLVWAASTPFTTPDADGELSSSTWLYSAPAAGGAPRRLARIGGATSDGEYERGTAVQTLAAAPGRLAWMTHGYDDAASKYQLGLEDAYSMGALGQGTFCRADEPPGARGETAGIALSGDTLALSGCKGASGVTVRDLAHPETPPQTLAPDGGPVSLAGNFVAWRTSDGFELLDRATGTRSTLSTAGLPTPAAGLPVALSEFAVSPEGVLAVTTGATPGATDGQLSWASPAEPTWHTRSVPGLSRGGLQVRANRIAFLTQRGYGAPRQLRLLDLAGRETVIAEGSGGPIGVPGTGFDFDGTSVAWGAVACDALIVGVRPIAAGTVALSDADHCPVVIDTAPVRAGRRGPLIGVRCPAPAVPRRSDRCAGSLTLERGDRVLGRARLKVVAGDWGDVRVKLTASGRRAVARRVRVTVAARSVTRGRASRTTARLTLRPSAR